LGSLEEGDSSVDLDFSLSLLIFSPSIFLPLPNVFARKPFYERLKVAKY